MERFSISAWLIEGVAFGAMMSTCCQGACKSVGSALSYCGLLIGIWDSRGTVRLRAIPPLSTSYNP